MNNRFLEKIHQASSEILSKKFSSTLDSTHVLSSFGAVRISMNPSKIDLFWTSLEKHLDILDTAVSPHLSKINIATAPINESQFEQSEYFFGAGFVAIQKYMLETCNFLRIDPKKAINLKVSDESKASFEAAVWVAANYWKHESEWWSVALESSGDKPPPSNMLRNLDIISEFGSFGSDYLCSNVLWSFSPSNELRLCSLLPLIRDWRRSLENQEGI